MKYTILSAVYANPDHTAAVIITKENAAVLVSSADTPEIWPDVLAASPQPFSATNPIPDMIPMWKAKAALAMAGKLSAANAAVSASGNDVLMLAWEYASEISRNSDALRTMASALKLSDDEVDQLFIAASKIVV